MTTMEITQVSFCFVHGYAHPEGEMDAIDTIPQELFVGPEAVLPCHEEDWEVCVLDDSEFTVQGDEDVEPRERGIFTLKAGDLAYIYTVRGGLVPCKVVSVADNAETAVRVTADRLGWGKGSLEVIRNPHVGLVARTQVTYHRGQPRIHGGLAVVSDSGKLIR